MTRLFASRQFLYFLLTGGLAAVVNFSSRIVLNLWMGFSEAIILAYLIGMITAFCLARRFVFTASTMPLRRSALFFTLVNLTAVLQTWLISMGLSMYVLPAMHVTRLVPEISHAVGVIVPAFTSYIGHKYVSFR